MNNSIDLAAVRQYLLGLQSSITQALTDIDGTPFLVDHWTKPAGEKLQGSGVTQILEGGPIFERAGCGFSHVSGPQLPPSATQHRPELAGSAFEAMGVSLVFHPRNPHVPTVHMNVRMIAAKPEGRAPVAWFGGGMDLTPYYGFEEDAVHFHQVCKDAVAPYGPDLHPRFKKWCDDYFFLKHRNEARGVGGIFYDDFSELGFEKGFAMMQDVGNGLLKAYMPLVMRRKDTPYGERERDFQLYRRGRYVEFNLVWDRGTHFGLQSGGRTESILLSMPALVSWSYNRVDAPDSAEAQLAQQFFAEALVVTGLAGALGLVLAWWSAHRQIIEERRDKWRTAAARRLPAGVSLDEVEQEAIRLARLYIAVHQMPVKEGDKDEK